MHATEVREEEGFMLSDTAPARAHMHPHASGLVIFDQDGAAHEVLRIATAVRRRWPLRRWTMSRRQVSPRLAR